MIGGLWLAGCVRVAKVLVQPDLAIVPPAGELAEVWVDAGYHGEVEHRWAGPPLDTRDGRHLARAESVTSEGQLRIVPTEPVIVRLWVQGAGPLDPHRFAPVHTVTGALPGQFTNELRFVGGPLDAPWTLALADLSNPWNATGFDHDDVLLVEVHRADAVERYLLQQRRVGWSTGFATGLLVRIPTVATADVTPILTAGPSFRWRSAKRSSVLRALDAVAVVGSVGIGSTELRLPDGSRQLTGVFDAVLVGGGLELLDVISVQILANASSLVREAEETPWTPAVGVDAVGVGALFRGAVGKLTHKHELATEAP